MIIMFVELRERIVEKLYRLSYITKTYFCVQHRIHFEFSHSHILANQQRAEIIGICVYRLLGNLLKDFIK